MSCCLECDALVPDIFHRLVTSIKDDHSPIILTYIESVFVGILDEALLEFLISILSQSQAIGSDSSSTAQVLSKTVLETLTS